MKFKNMLFSRGSALKVLTLAMFMFVALMDATSSLRVILLSGYKVTTFTVVIVYLIFCAEALMLFFTGRFLISRFLQMTSYLQHRCRVWISQKCSSWPMPGRSLSGYEQQRKQR